MTTKELKIQIALGSFSRDDIIKLVRNKRTTKKILTVLSKDEDWQIRYWVAGNPNTPIDILKKLSIDKDNVVRCRVAENSNTPTEILEKLSTDDNSEYVKHYATRAMTLEYRHKYTGL